MIQFEYDGVRKRYNVTVPFTLKSKHNGEYIHKTTNTTVASISEDNKITMHRELRIEVVRQILMHWDEYEHQITRQEEQ